MDIKTAMGQLHITQAQANHLDALDGTQDNQITKSVFEFAKQVLENNVENQSQNANPLLEKIKNILGKTNPAEVSETKPETEPEAVSEKGQAEQPKSVKQMEELANKALEYFSDNNRLRGFSFMGFPTDVKNVKIATEYGYEDSSNDIFTIDDNAQQSVKRNADSFTIKISFEIDGKEYSVNAKTNTPPNIEGTALQEELGWFEEEMAGPSAEPTTIAPSN